MKTKSRNLIISFLITLAMLFSVFAITPLTASAVSTPAPEDTLAETIYVGGVELQMDQYVMNGSSTAVDGTPADDADGFAWYSEDGLLLVNYVYEGQGHLYDGDNYAVISSTGLLVIEFIGTNKLTQTEEYGTGIYAGGNLVIDGFGSTAGCLEVTASFALYADYSLFIEPNAREIKINSDYQAMTADDLIVFGGGDVDITTYYPISLMSTEDTAQIVIVNGSVEVKSNSGAFAIPPYLDDYNDRGKVVEFILSENSDGSNPLEAGSTIDINNFSKYKYFYFGEVEVEPEYIETISVSGADLPEVGETSDDMMFSPDSLTYGGAYKMVGRSFEKYTGTEWVDYDEALEYGVKYRVSLVLAPNVGYAFADSITSDDVTFNGKAGIFETLISGVGYAVVCYEFSYEAPATDYGITIADKDGSGATVGVLITEENCTDVLGDGTVSYDPTTNTLTLNNYVYNGEGALVDEGGYMAIMADIPTEGLTIVLVGTNSITVSGSDSAGMVFFGEGNLTIKGNGSLSTNTIMYGITVQTDSGKLTVENAKLNITTTGAMAIGIQATDFVMTSGDLKITASMIGVGTSKEDGICINGGSVEIGTATGGYAFIYLDFEHLSFNPIAPDLSGYVGAHKMTAGINVDGSDATDFNEGYLNSYKYVKVEPTHVHDHGTTWVTDANEHWNECECGDKANKAAHTDSDTNGKCDVCGADVPVAPPSHTHDYGTIWKTDANNHWNECSCGDKANVGTHVDSDNNGKCDACGKDMPTTPGGGSGSETPEKPDEPKDGLSGGAIAGIVVGSVVVLGLGGFALVWFVIKKKSFADLIAIFKKK